MKADVKAKDKEGSLSTSELAWRTFRRVSWYGELQVLNTFYFLTGYLGFLATWIMDTIYTFVKNDTLRWWDVTVKNVARALSPHFVLARGLYDISQVRAGLSTINQDRDQSIVICTCVPVFQHSNKNPAKSIVIKISPRCVLFFQLSSKLMINQSS